MRPPRGLVRGGRGRGRGRGRSEGRGGRFGRAPEGPPERVEEVGSVMHACEGDLVCRLTHSMIPYFNASIYVDKDTKVGRVDEILGPINAVMFTVKPDQGVVATSFQADDKLCIDPMKLLPLSRFTNPGSGGGGGGRGGRGGSRGRGFPGRSRGSPGRGGSRGAFRGGRGGRASPGGRRGRART